MSVIKSIKGNKDNYKLDEVNCFEKPVGIVLDSYNQTYSHMFYMYLKMIKAYHLERSYVENEEYYSMELIKAVLKEELKIDLHKKNLGEDLHDFIQSKLDKQTAILIPGNLKELFYSKYYKKENWGHLFILKGYDSERKIYTIIDSTQDISGDLTKYSEFFMEYDIVNRLIESYQREFHGNKCVWYLEKLPKNEVVKDTDAIRKCLDIYINNFERSNYLDFNNYIQSYKDNNFENMFKQMLLEAKWKNVFLNEVIYFSEILINDKRLIEELISNKENFINNLITSINKIQANFYRFKSIDFREHLSKIMLNENILLKNIIEIRNKLEGIDLEKSKVLNNSNIDYSFENNEDFIISSNKKDEYIFEFNNEKAYDSWFSDNSPKVVIKRIEKEEKVTIHTKLNLIKYSEVSKFHAGIFIRTKNNQLYFWGTNCGQTIRLDQVGIHDNLCDVKYCESSIWLRVKIYEDILILEYSVEGKANFTEAKRIALEQQVSEVGIGCKTWERNDGLILKFDDLLVE